MNDHTRAHAQCFINFVSIAITIRKRMGRRVSWFQFQKNLRLSIFPVHLAILNSPNQIELVQNVFLLPDFGSKEQVFCRFDEHFWTLLFVFKKNDENFI